MKRTETVNGGEAVSEWIEKLPQKFDCNYDGDIARCDKDCAKLGVCKRRTCGPQPTEQDDEGPEFPDGPDEDGFRGPRPWNNFAPCCGKCGLTITTGAMALLCPHGKSCELYAEGAEEFAAAFAKPTDSGREG